jgi:acetoin utilization protein AcuB
MIVEEIMVKKPITVKTDDSLDTAQNLMVSKSIRHLPVVDGKELVGIITESDIRSSFLEKPETALNPKNMKVRDHMTREPFTVFPETHIEDAALIIYKNKIGSLPVVADNKLVGIITTMDLLGLFIDMMGIIHSSSRIDVIMGKDTKNFDTVSGIFHDHGIHIISVGMSPFNKSKDKRVYLFRTDLCDTKPLVKAIEEAGFKVKSAID